MLLSLVYFAIRRMLRLITGGSERDDVAREIEILVLRHQLRVLGRNRRAPLRRRDRVLLTAASRLLERDRWRSFPVWSADSAALHIASWCGTSGPTDADAERAGPG
jgi:hypothetical protein